MSIFSLSKIGLIVNAIGAILLVIGADKMTAVLTKFVSIVKDTYSTHGMGLVIDDVKKLSNDFERDKRVSLLYNRIGYFLFVVGFMLQLLENQPD